MQGTQESTPSKYSSPCNWHSAGMVHLKYKINFMIEATLGHYIFTSITHIKTSQRHCIAASLGKLNGSSDHSAKTSHGPCIIYECCGEK